MPSPAYSGENTWQLGHKIQIASGYNPPVLPPKGSKSETRIKAQLLYLGGTGNTCREVWKRRGSQQAIKDVIKHYHSGD